MLSEKNSDKRVSTTYLRRNMDIGDFAEIVWSCRHVFFHVFDQYQIMFFKKHSSQLCNEWLLQMQL